MTLIIDDKVLSEAKGILNADSELTKSLGEKPVEAIGMLMSERAEPGVKNFDALSPLWGQFKREMAILLCTDDPKYEAIRKDLVNVEEATRMYVVPGVAGVIGRVIGVGVAVLTPFVALGLIATAKIGVQSWCNLQITPEPNFTDAEGQPVFLKTEK